jgi:large-conductance mechanosensitive channel
LKSFLIGIKDGFHAFGQHISNGINFIILAIVYYLGIGLVSLIAKITGKKFLKMSKNGKDSYWDEKKLGTLPRDHYYRMF